MRKVGPVALLLACSACVFPFYSSDPLPDFAPYVPADFGSPDTEVLALAVVASNWSRPSPWFSEPLFAKRQDLQSIRQRLSARSKAGMFSLDYGLKGQGWIRQDKIETVTLLDLCLVSADGQTLSLSGHDGQGWTNVRHGVFPISARNALADALRREPDAPIVGLNGPCGTHGIVDWSAEKREQVRAFLTRVVP